MTTGRINQVTTGLPSPETPRSAPRVSSRPEPGRGGRGHSLRSQPPPCGGDGGRAGPRRRAGRRRRRRGSTQERETGEGSRAPARRRGREAKPLRSTTKTETCFANPPTATTSRGDGGAVGAPDQSRALSTGKGGQQAKINCCPELGQRCNHPSNFGLWGHAHPAGRAQPPAIQLVNTPPAQLGRGTASQKTAAPQQKDRQKNVWQGSAQLAPSS